MKRKETLHRWIFPQVSFFQSSPTNARVWFFSLSPCLWLSLSVIVPHPFFPGNDPANQQGPEDHLLPPATLASQDTPDGFHSGCSLKSSQLPTPSAYRKSLLYCFALWVNLLKGYCFFHLHCLDGVADHRQAGVLVYFLQLMICYKDRAISRMPIVVV